MKVLAEILGNGPLRLLNERSLLKQANSRELVLIQAKRKANRNRDCRAYPRARPSMDSSESGRTPDKLLLFNFLLNKEN